MKLYYLPRTAIEAEILYQALYVLVQRLITGLSKKYASMVESGYE